MKKKEEEKFTNSLPGLPIETREDLARFLFDTNQEKFVKLLTSILYGKKRSSYYQKFEINKSTGKPRTIHAVTGKLKDLQRTALNKLQSIRAYKPSFYAHGFTPDRNIISNAKCHRNSKIIIKVDIKDFFPSINFLRVQGMFMAPPFRFGKEAATTMAHLACLDDESSALPQGGVLSPYVSNMLCRRMDKRLAGLARGHRCQFTRYADDMTFSTNNTRNLNTKEFLVKTYEIIESENFSVNLEKEKTITRKDRQMVTGIVVNDGMNINRKYIRNIRATIYNCEKTGVAKQIADEREFKDKRNSRISYGSDEPPTEKDFLKHLLGKINFFGSVILSSGQKEQYDDGYIKYQRIRTYEELLWRFYNLNEVKKTQHKDIRKEIKDPALKFINNRPRLKERLSVRWKLDEIRKSCKAEYNVKNIILIEKNKSKINGSRSIEEIKSIVFDLEKTDPRYFLKNFTHDQDKAKRDAIKLLNYPNIDKYKATDIFNSLKSKGDHELKKIVHTEKGFTVEDCYKALNESYEKKYYYLPFALRKEFDDWRKKIDEIFELHGSDYKLDVVNDPLISEETKKLKKNTRFGRSSAGATVLIDALNEIKDESRSRYENIKINLDNVNRDSFSQYTHVPSILESIEYVFNSISKNSFSKNKEIEVKVEDNEDFIEIIISDNSTEPQMARLVNRDFVHGKLGNVIRLTNGLCDYFIEITQSDGTRACLNMHNEKVEDPKLETGFVHRLIFSPKIT